MRSFCHAPSFGERLSVAGSSFDGSSAEGCGSTRGSSFRSSDSSCCATRGSSRRSWRRSDRSSTIDPVLTAPLLVDRLALGIQERVKDALATIPARTLDACARTSVAATVRAVLIDAMSAAAYDEPLDRQPPHTPVTWTDGPRTLTKIRAHTRLAHGRSFPRRTTSKPARVDVLRFFTFPLPRVPSIQRRQTMKVARRDDLAW